MNKKVELPSNLRGLRKKSNSKKRLEALEKQIKSINSILGINDPIVDNIHYLVIQIRQLRTMLDRKMQIMALMETYLRDIKKFDDFKAWVNKRAEEERKKREAEGVPAFEDTEDWDELIEEELTEEEPDVR